MAESAHSRTACRLCSWRSDNRRAGRKIGTCERQAFKKDMETSAKRNYVQSHNRAITLMHRRDQSRLIGAASQRLLQLETRALAILGLEKTRRPSYS